MLLPAIAICGISCSNDTSDSTADPSFVGRENCVSCHEEEAEAYAGSHHDLAMQEATDETVLADFSGSTFTDDNRQYTFDKEDGQFFVRVESVNSDDAETYPVPYTFGVQPLQQYLLKFPKGRLQALTIAWDSQKNEWFSLYPDRTFEKDNWLHWTNQSQNWNSTCASCHSTNYKKNYDPESDSYDPSWSEIDVSCESCHGPGSRHVEMAKNAENYDEAATSQDNDHGFPVQFTSGDVAFRTGSDGVPERVNPNRTVSDAQLTECGRCHGRRSDLSKHHRHGDRFLDHFEPSLLREGIYHADGQVQEEVYVYGSFRQSKMYQKGVRCTDCHNAHSGELKLEGNELCTQCHGDEQYNTPDHHHHPPSSEGASCVNCHMTEKTFMQVDPRRDHKFHVPDPAVSDAVDSPDACTSCHTDKSQQWAAGHVDRWSGDNRSSSRYGPMFHAAWNGDTDVRSDLISFLTNQEKPTFLRASAANTIGQLVTDPGNRSSIRNLLDESDPLLRRTGARLFIAGRNNNGNVSPDPLVPLLSDPVRGVRFAAARSLSTMDLSGLDDEQRKRVENLVDQIEAVLLTNQDTRSGLFSLGQFYAQQEQPENAITYLRRAIRMDAKFLDARTTLAQLLAGQERPSEAASVLQPVIRQERPPEMSEQTWNRAKGRVYFQLGLLNAGPLNNRTSARNYLERAVRLTPNNARAHFNLGLLYSKMGDVDQADHALNRARDLQPDNPRYLYTLVTVHRDHGQMEKAVEYARTLKNEFPNNPRYQRVFRLMKRQAR